MSVQAMCLSFVSKQTSGGGEDLSKAFVKFAPERLDV